jgi:hypothetical protein
MAMIVGCTTTRYLGPLDVVTPDAPGGRLYPPMVPKVVAVTGTSAVLQYPGGGREPIATGGTYVQVETNYGLGAVEGFLGGAAIGLAAGGLGSQGCGSSDCTAGALVGGALVAGLVGALYGVIKGHKTTYVLGARPR